MVDDASNNAPELEKDQFWPGSEVGIIYASKFKNDMIKQPVGRTVLSL